MTIGKLVMRKYTIIAWLCGLMLFSAACAPNALGTTALLDTSTTLAQPAAQHATTSARVYTADQSSNTVSVIDPASDTLLGQIVLGNVRPNVLGAKYYKQVNVHGLGYAPDGQTLVVVNVTTNGVTFVDTATNSVKGTVYVGRAPHEAFFIPNGKEVWVAVRGQDYISVIDPAALKEVRQIKTMSNPSKVMFRPDGKYAFVNSAEVAEFDVIDTATYSVVARVPVVSPFSPDLTVTPDGKEVWLGHKDVGKVTEIDAQTFQVLNVIDTGKVTNHVAPVSNANGDFIYVTVGGTHEVVVIQRGPQPSIVQRIKVGADPHGLWPTPDNLKLYVGLENEDAVQVIDTLTNKVTRRIPIGQSPQALVVVPGASGSDNLQMAVVGQRVVELELKGEHTSISGTAVVRAEKGIDEFQLNVSGLAAGAKVDVFLTQRASAPFGVMQYLGAFTADGTGKIDNNLYSAIFNATVIASDGAKQKFNFVAVWSADNSPLNGNAGQPLLVSSHSFR